jgi:hypothetical protein
MPDLFYSILRPTPAAATSGCACPAIPRSSSSPNHGSGDLTYGFKAAQPIVKKRTVVGYLRGDGMVRIDLDTGSGDVSIDPTP